eukprot:CAMPEP_0198120536 /NCGR_PEP_ID=MMETSP1442-20131203/29356_1 /TAXON_ID= /ORGANISM="Craspedostauros australis, Strain CCMP3328" /LENGTH=175 /DNA_ID=CAMNT_0043779197 /DNA_START=80 /DNA_END=607 /DNA_ORIENTATION=+
MKFASSQPATLLAAVMIAQQTTAFAPRQMPSSAATQLQASKQSFWAPVAGALVGLSLASQIAGAEMPPAPMPSIVVADNLSLDFSMPSYNPTSKSTGFGDGTEAYLSTKTSDGRLTDPGSDERQKQMESMKKAEEARKVRLAAEKEKQKEREAEDKIRAAAKKAERERRLKGIFD